MDLGLSGKWALITGSSKGIGLACAESLAAEGCNVHLVARTASALEEARESILSRYSVKANLHALDLSRPESITSLVDRCGSINILINNAGAVPRRELLNVDDFEWRKAWDLKVFACINLTREVYRQMRARGTGVIVNVIGMAGEAPNPRSIIASTGNASLMAFSSALGAESVDYGIRVIGVNPGLVLTERTESLVSTNQGPDAKAWRSLVERLPFKRMASTKEIADVVAFLASDRASYVSGTVVTVDGGAVNRR
jgi:NAD(P)-dependent dehydrogenase (short-subunit alcohol dehydrogenase family)